MVNCTAKQIAIIAISAAGSLLVRSRRRRSTAKCPLPVVPHPVASPHATLISTDSDSAPTRFPVSLHLQAIKLLRLRDAWRLRTLPGPYALPLVGNAFTMVKTQGGFVGWRDAMHKTYGKVFKVSVSRTYTL